jgi:hypothetical protein
VTTVEQTQTESPKPSDWAAETAGFGVVVAALAALAAAWIAAGSTGLLAHPLRRALTLVALGAALLAPGISRSRFWWRVLLTPLVACAAGYMVALAAPAANVMAVTLVLAFLVLVADGRNRDILRAAAAAVAVLGLYVFARTSIPWIWLFADGVARSLARLVSLLTNQPLRVGATFAGLDCLIAMAVLWSLCVRRTRPPRTARALYGFAAIMGGHLLYLVVLSYVPSLLDTIASPGGDLPLTGLLREAMPWNLPAMACAIQLAIAGAMFRWSAWAPTGQAPRASRPVASAVSRLAWATATLSMAMLLPVATTLHTKPLTMTGKKIVFYEKGFLNWLKPTHGSYGRLFSGMYGMLPTFVESLGAKSIISPDLSQADLDNADALVLIFPNELWINGQLDRIERFVRRGGSLLVMGEHTTADPNGSNRFNEALVPTAMKVRFDSATFAVGGWLDSYEAISHPTTAGIGDDRNQFGVVIGASVDAKWPARPLLVGRWGWADRGDQASDRAMMGNSRYDAGEKLGDIVLAAEQRLGKGRVVVFGDTSSLSNAINVSSHVFTSRLLAYLAGGTPDAHPAWRQLVGMLIVVFLLVLLWKRPSEWRAALIAAGLTASLVVCTSATATETDVLPDGRDQSPNNLAYIDASGLEAYSGESWRPDGIGGLALTLMRNGYLPLTLPELTGQRLARAGLLICAARSRTYSEAEVRTIAQFVSDGGILIMTVGWDRAGPSLPLLKQFGFGIGADEVFEPAPLGHFKSPYLESAGQRVYVRFHAAWPIRCADLNARVIAYGRDDQPVIMQRRVGAGKVVLIGDTFFATNQNLEREDGTPFEGLRENADFWRWLIALLRDEQVWIPPTLQGDANQEVVP